MDNLSNVRACGDTFSADKPTDTLLTLTKALRDLLAESDALSERAALLIDYIEKRHSYIMGLLDGYLEICAIAQKGKQKCQNNDN